VEDEKTPDRDKRKIVDFVKESSEMMTRIKIQIMKWKIRYLRLRQQYRGPWEVL